MVDIYQDMRRQGIHLALFTDPEGDSCFSIYQISWIEMKKKSTFCTFKTSLNSRNFINITNISGILSSAFLRSCYKFSIMMTIIFYLPANSNKNNNNNNNNNNNDLEVAHPQSGSSSTLFLFLIEVEFGNVGF